MSVQNPSLVHFTGEDVFRFSTKVDLLLVLLLKVKTCFKISGACLEVAEIN